ncbi:MAG TPA: hypothetical protein VHG51_12380 [Longimicrobiaceae bacterium]|nr:hypothetical protein [Longimicrobiaceae bacterium]
MKSELYDALRAATEGEFELLGELDCDGAWIAYLAAAGADGALAILLLHRTPDGQEYDLQVAHALDGSLAVGKTTCPACGTTADGWPRFCAGCRRDLSGVAADAAVPGCSPRELLEAVRQVSEGVYDVLGAMRHAQGGGAMYFATEEGGRIVGLVLEREADGELSLVRSWAYDHEALAGDDAPAAAWTGEAPAAAPLAAAGYAAAAEPEPELAPVLVEPVPAAAALLLDPEPVPGTRAPSRRVLYGAAGALLVAAGLVLAFVVVQRDSSATPVTTLTSADAPAPAPVPAQPVPAFTDSPAVATPAPEPPTPAPSTRRTRPRPTPPPVAVEEPRPPEPAGPTPGQDRAAARAAVARYASAVESRRMDRVRAAYPGMSAEETARWTEWFSHFGRGDDLSVSYAVSQGPVIEGDVATMTFTLTMRYQGQLQRVTSRATLRRDGSGWALQALNTPQ